MAQWLQTKNGVQLVQSDARTSCARTFVVKDRDGKEVRVPCGRCDSCRKFKLTNMVGMLQAEALSAGSVWFLSLTYAPENYRETFYYRDVANMMKRLRHVYPGIRFFAVGEKGDLTQRNHWHLLLFFPDFQRVPNLRRGVPARFGAPAVKGELWEFWPHGFSSIKQVKTWSPRDMAKQVRYCAMYLFKSDDKGSYDTVKAHWSCKPVLGAKFLFDQAMSYARANSGKLRLPLYISFPGDRVAAGGPLWKYPILGARRGHYIRAYNAECERLYGVDHDRGGIEVAEKVKRKDLLGAAEDARLLELERWQAFLAKHSRGSERGLTLREKWKAYDAKLSSRDFDASYAGYSRDIEQSGTGSVGFEPGGFAASPCLAFGIACDAGGRILS